MTSPIGLSLSLLAVLALPRAVTAQAAATPTTYRVIPGMSRASYAVDEVFFRENNRLFTAVGVTDAVSGEITASRARPAHARIAEIVVDLRPLKSDSDRRDRALREKYLDTNRFPHARLSGARLHGLPPTVTDGEAFRYSLVGDLTLHGVTRATTWQGEATVTGDTLRGVARTSVKMSQFGIEVPSLLSLRSADDVLVEIRFIAASVPGGTR